MIDHDRLFKELLTAFFADFVNVFLPDLSRYLDTISLEFLDKEVFSDLIGGERQEADLIVRARFQDGGAFFLVHVEHQAQGQSAFGRRFFRYFARFHEKYELPVYPIALFSHDGSQAEPDLYQVRFPDREVLRFQYRVIQLSRMRWEDYAGRASPTAAALMAKMGMNAEERRRVKLECLRLLSSLPLERERIRFLSGFVDTYLRLTPVENLQFEAQADRLLERTERNKVIELTTSWKEEGRQEGRREGRVEMVLRQLCHRCGPVPAPLELKVRRLSESELAALAEALLDFTALTDLEQWLSNR